MRIIAYMVVGTFQTRSIARCHGRKQTEQGLIDTGYEAGGKIVVGRGATGKNGHRVRGRMIHAPLYQRSVAADNGLCGNHPQKGQRFSGLVAFLWVF